VNNEPLEQFLNRPVKRITEYNLLLQKLDESMFDWQMDSKHFHIASKLMGEIVSFFNICIHRKENIEKVLEIEQQITTFNSDELMINLAEEATRNELKNKGSENESKVKSKWMKHFQRIRLVKPSRCFVSEIEVVKVDADGYQRRMLILLSDVLLVCKKKAFLQRLDLLNVLSINTMEVRVVGKKKDMEKIRKLRKEINDQDKQISLYKANPLEGRFLFFIFTPDNTYLFDAQDADARRRFIMKLEGALAKKRDENIDKKEKDSNTGMQIALQNVQQLQDKIPEMKQQMDPQMIKKKQKVKMIVKKKKFVRRGIIENENNNRSSSPSQKQGKIARSINTSNLEKIKQSLTDLDNEQQKSPLSNQVNNDDNEQEQKITMSYMIQKSQSENMLQNLQIKMQSGRISPSLLSHRRSLSQGNEQDYEQVEYEEEVEQEQEIEVEELIPVSSSSSNQMNDDNNSDDINDLQRNCISPSLQNPFKPPKQPKLWQRLMNEWNIKWSNQQQCDEPKIDEQIPLLKQDSGSTSTNVSKEIDV
ncbi:MAG: hypothetical protein EZS28_030976, partial [Streblomastix strix]